MPACFLKIDINVEDSYRDGKDLRGVGKGKTVNRTYFMKQ